MGAGGLWHDYTLRALRSRGTPRKPGPRRRFDSSIAAFCRDRADWYQMCRSLEDAEHDPADDGGDRG